MRRLVDIEKASDELARRWLGGETLFVLAAECGCHWQSMRKYIMARVPKEVYAAASKEHLRAQGRRCPTQFKPGHAVTQTSYKSGTMRGAAARRHVAIGTVRLRKFKNNRGRMVPWYWSIKVKDDPYSQTTNWKPVSVYVWEAKHGKLPKGWFVVHKDGNRMNHAYENLKAIPKADMLRHARSVRPKRFCGPQLSRAIAQAQRDRAALRAAGIRRTA